MDFKLIDKEISLNRLEKIQQKLFEHQIQKNKSLENNTIEVLVENQTEDKTKLFGRSEYMTSVIFSGNEESIGQIVKVKINKSNQNTLFGEAVTDLNQKVDDSLLNREPLFKRKKTVKRVIEKIMSFIETFTEGLAA